MLLWGTENLHDTRELLLFVFSREYRIACEQFGQYTSHTPHIDGHAIRHAQNDFRRTVETTLDISVHLFVLETTRSEIDRSNVRGQRVNQKDIFRLQIAMDNLLRMQQDQCAKHLFRETTYELQVKASEIMGLDKLVEVHPQKFSRNAKMSSEVETLSKVDHAMTTVRIPFLELLEEVYLNQGLLVEPLLVANDLHSNQAPRFVIDTSHHLTEATLSQNINDFVSVGQMVSDDNVVVTSLIVIAKISLLGVEVTDMFLRILSPAEKDVPEVNDLAMLENVQVRHSQRLCWANTLLRSRLATQVIQLPCSYLKVLALATQSPHFLITRDSIGVYIGVNGPRAGRGI